MTRLDTSHQATTAESTPDPEHASSTSASAPTFLTLPSDALLFAVHAAIVGLVGLGLCFAYKRRVVVWLENLIPEPPVDGFEGARIEC